MFVACEGWQGGRVIGQVGTGTFFFYVFPLPSAAQDDNIDKPYVFNFVAVTLFFFYQYRYLLAYCMRLLATSVWKKQAKVEAYKKKKKKFNEFYVFQTKVNSRTKQKIVFSWYLKHDSSRCQHVRILNRLAVMSAPPPPPRAIGKLSPKIIRLHVMLAIVPLNAF